MPKQRWTAFSDAHRDAHAVVALVLLRDRPATDKTRVASTRLLLERLIEGLVPAGAYATSVVAQHGLAVIYCAFEKEADAQSLAKAVRARPTKEHLGWASQWSFVLHGQERGRSKPH
jgi:hypothetical protein